MLVLNILVLSANYFIFKFSNYNMITNKMFIIISGILIIIGISLFKNEILILGTIIIIISIFDIAFNMTSLLLIKYYKSYDFGDIIQLYSFILIIGLLLLVIEELSEDSFIDHFIPSDNPKYKK